MTGIIVTAFATALLAAFSMGHAQGIAPSAGTMNPASHVILEMSGFNSESEAKILGPANFLEQLRNGTLRELELEVAPGPLNDALARANRTRTHLNGLALRAKPGIGKPLKIEMKDVIVTSYNFPSASSNRDKFGRVKVQFHSDPTSQPASVLTPKHQNVAQSIFDDPKPPGGAPSPSSASAEIALLLPGIGEHPARVLAPADFLEQLRRGTLRELEVEVDKGPLSDALTRVQRTRGRLPTLTLKAEDGAAKYHVIELKNVVIVGPGMGGSDTPPKVVFQWGSMTRIP